MYNPRFSITPIINKNIAEIERIRTIVDRSRILPIHEIALRHRAIIEATRSSTGIEGNPLNEEEVAKVFAGKRILQEDRFVTEVRNYKRALQVVYSRVKQQQMITIRDILKLHSLVMEKLLPLSRLGKWRQTPIYIVNRKQREEEVVYRGPKASQVPKLIRDLLMWLANKSTAIHPLLVAGILHFEFVSIHPFADGNGRVTRLLTLWYLVKLGYAFRKVLVPDTYYFSNRKAYYQALNRAKTYPRQHTADMTPWLEYFIGGLLTVAQEILEKVTLETVIPEQGKTLILSESDYKMIDFALTMGKITLSDAISIVNLPKRTVQRKLKRLTDSGIFRLKGKGPSSYYIIKRK